MKKNSMKKRGQKKHDWFLILTYAVTVVVLVMSLLELTKFSYTEFLDFAKHGAAWFLVLYYWAYVFVLAAAPLIGLWLYKKGQKFSFTFKLFIVVAAIEYATQAWYYYQGSVYGGYAEILPGSGFIDQIILAFALVYHATNSAWVKGLPWKILYWIGLVAGVLGLLTRFVPLNW